MSRPPGVTYAPGSPYRPLSYPQRPAPPGCADGSHTLAFSTTDRTGAKTWVCRACPAVREFGDPTWRTP